MSQDPSSDVPMLAAALRADATDLDAYAAVLTSTLAEALPAGMVAVERDRSLRDRLAGRPGVVRSVRVQAGNDGLELLRGPAGPQARVVTEVAGVVIARREVGLAEWSELLAQHLSVMAAQSAAARAALSNLLGL